MQVKARAAIYARFSSDLQRDRSIEDQVAYCRDYAARTGYEIVAVFSDRAVTGSSMHDRPGIRSLLAAARTGAFEFTLAESLSRIARDEEDSPAIRKRLDFAGVKIVTPADGVVSPLLHGLRTIIDSEFLVGLKSNIRRGMSGVVRDGRHPGGATYGYRPVPGRPGDPEIVEEEAAVVRRIFAEYIAGEVPRAIAGRLNAENVAPPRGSFWRASTINGNAKRSTGILLNEIYCGRILWNRARTIRDPDTNQRVRRPKPVSEWQHAASPRLRIIEDATFEAAQRVRSQRANMRPRGPHRPKRILSGLLRCGACGAGMSKKDTDHGRPRLICSQRREARSCDHRRVYYLDEIERLVVDGLRDQLGTREAIAYFVRCCNEERQRVAGSGGDRRAELLAKIETAERKISRAVQAVIDERITDAEAAALLPGLRADRDRLAAEIAGLGQAPKVVTLRPAAVETYLADLKSLSATVNAGLAAGQDGMAKVIRSYVETVTVMPTPAGREPGLRVSGHLTSLMTLDPSQMGSQVGGNGGAGCPAPPDPPTLPLRFTLLLGALRAA